MLTLYSEESTFKKKLTVIIIWLLALILGAIFIDFLENQKISLLLKTLVAIAGLFMITGILLRCKIARGLTLITLYFLALFPLLSNYLIDGSFILFSFESPDLFTPTEAFLSNLVWASFFILPIYFLSNDKSMEIFYIESNPKEHIFFILGAIILIFLSVSFILKPLLLQQ